MKLVDELKKSLYSWYPFEKDANIVYAVNGEKVDFSIFSNDSVDYVVASFLIEKAADVLEVLGEIKRVLKPTGHLLLGTENRLGLRYFCGDHEPYSDKSFDGIEGYANYLSSDRANLDGRLYAAYEIKELLDSAGFSSRRQYSILPGLEMPQQMYASDYIPEEEIAIRFTGLYHNPDSVFLDEAKLYDGLIKNGMFHQMANAYLWDCSVNGDFYEINHVTTSMDRGPAKATATIIEKNGTVIKKALYEEGNSAIETLLANTREIELHGVKTVPLIEVSFANGCKGVAMPYMKCETALTYLRRIFWEDIEKFKKETNRFIELILKSSEPSERQVDGNELGSLYNKVYIDMVPLNCFYDGKDFVFYDQEYVEENYPIYMPILRALDIIYMGDRAMLEKLPIEYFLQESGVLDKINALRSMAVNYLAKLRSQDELAAFRAEHGADIASVNINRQKVNYSFEDYCKIFINLVDDCRDKDIYVFGAGLWARKFIAEYKDRCSIKNLLDNNPNNTDKVIDGVTVVGPEILKDCDLNKVKVIVCVKYYATILLQLKKCGVKNFGIYDPNADWSVLKGDEIVLSDMRISTDLNTKQKDDITDKANTTDLSNKKYKVGYVAGVFDLFHIGHLNVLRRAKEHCEYLIVGVVSDEQASKGKSRSPYINENERVEIVRACKYVDEAFILPIAASGTRDVYKRCHFDVQFSGSDYEHNMYWLGEQKWLRERGSDLVFFPYTQSTSSTKLKKVIENND